MKSSLPIGVTDSGIGGISVLNALKTVMPNESYIYLSDTKNSPYGTKTPNEIQNFTLNNIKTLMLYPCKAVVIACNTATAVAIEQARAAFKNLPIIGLEPAIKPALHDFPTQKIMVLATQITLTQNKLHILRHSLTPTNDDNFVFISAQKIVSFVESDMLTTANGDVNPALIGYLKSLFSPYKKHHFSAVVLGCTHFPFAKRAISEALGYNPKFYDGSLGAANRTFTVLSQNNLLNSKPDRHSVTWLGCKHSSHLLCTNL